MLVNLPTQSLGKSIKRKVGDKRSRAPETIYAEYGLCRGISSLVYYNTFHKNNKEFLEARSVDARMQSGN